jgi:hypothetical protein
MKKNKNKNTNFLSNGTNPKRQGRVALEEFQRVDFESFGLPRRDPADDSVSLLVSVAN